MTSVDAAVHKAIEALRKRPSALISDIDGTLSRIVSRPEDAVVSGRAQAALADLAQYLDLVAVITGRPDDVARKMVGVDNIVYMGSYALDAASALQLTESDIGLIKEQAPALLAGLPCVTLEEKAISFAFHYRNCPEPERVRLKLLDRLEPLTKGAGGRLLEGKRVIEVVPDALPNKDVAFAKLVADRQLRGVVFMGDDGADASVFRAISGRRERDLSGLAIAVVDAETPPSVIEAADLTLAGVDEVEEFLDLLLAAIQRGIEWRQPVV